MTTPAQGSRIPPGALYACDNSRFGSDGKGRYWPGTEKWFAWLSRTVERYGPDRCLWALAPDEPFDAVATLTKSLPWLARIRELGIPAAYAAQDGCDQPGLLPWDSLDVLFLAGTTEWKLGPVAERLAREAQIRGKSVHMGRVNSLLRMRIAEWFGCDSVDGTYLAYGPDKNLPKLLSWLDELDGHPSLLGSTHHPEDPGWAARIPPPRHASLSARENVADPATRRTSAHPDPLALPLHGARGTARAGSPAATTPDQRNPLSPPHPDFELYDNIGRTPEQDAAAYTGTATRDDLRRWSRRDSKKFLAQHPLPGTSPPALDPGPYIAALAAAKTPAEVSAVTQHLLDAAFPTVREVSHLLVDIARWGGRHRSAAPDSPPKMLMTAASRCLDALALADQADIRVLRDEYDPVPKPPQPGAESAPGLPPSPPVSPPASAPHRSTTRRTP